jgi:1,2-phenylacetyl-CoA epoxidase catalytic subunit
MHANVRSTTLPKKFHEAVERWRDTFLPDYQFLLDHWEKYFPRDPTFCLCAYRQCGMPDVIEVGDQKGQPKFTRARDMAAEQSQHLLGAIRAQASTEFGSIQQHQLTLARAQDEEDQFWILRMMAEELRHGYQMLHLMLEDDWTGISKKGAADMVEEILQMRTGSHVLGAFNIDYDSFVDNVVFCALIDRVGKYQLSMQKVSAYKPMAESMPPMLHEEAFHLAAGVVPLRRWVQKAAAGEVYVTMDVLQRHLNKWVPRGLDMFGDERGGATNVRYGLKTMANAEALDQYHVEVQKMLDDLNERYVRARLPQLSSEEAEALLERAQKHGEAVQGIRPEDLLRLPDKRFLRRRGVHAFQLAGVAGETFTDLNAFAHYLTKHLPEQYRAGRDFKDYLELTRQVAAGEVKLEDAVKRMPSLRRVGGVCPCSRAVRWVQDEGGNGGSGKA